MNPVVQGHFPLHRQQTHAAGREPDPCAPDVWHGYLKVAKMCRRRGKQLPPHCFEPTRSWGPCSGTYDSLYSCSILKHPVLISGHVFMDDSFAWLAVTKQLHNYPLVYGTRGKMSWIVSVHWPKNGDWIRSQRIFSVHTRQHPRTITSSLGVCQFKFLNVGKSHTESSRSAKQ
jgi:hypothetical protein